MDSISEFGRQRHGRAWHARGRDTNEGVRVSENEALLRNYLRAGDAADRAALGRVLHPDVVTHAPGDLTLHGLHEVVATWMAAHQGLDDLSHVVEASIGAGDTAAARLRVSGVHRGTFLGIEATGKRIEVDQALFIRVEGSRIVEMWEIVDAASGLRQLGALGDQPLTPGEPC